MKKIVSLALCLFLFVFSVAPVSEATAWDEGDREYLEDGSYILVGFNDDAMEDEDLAAEEESQISFIQRLINLIKKLFDFLFGKKEEAEGNTVQIRAVSKTKYAKYYDSDDNLLWSVYLTGYFRYNGEMSECTDVSVSFDIKDSDWRLISAEGTKNGSGAEGKFILKQYKLGVPLKEIEKVLTLTCDENGNVK